MVAVLTDRRSQTERSAHQREPRVLGSIIRTLQSARSCCYCSYGYHVDMAHRTRTTTFDPADPVVRSDAKTLAGRLGGSTPVEAAVRGMLNDVAHGARVVVLRADDEVTPAQAADVLGVTRQFVDRLCEDGVLPFRRLPNSRHRRIRLQDVVDIAAEREQRRTGAEAIRAALGE